MPPISQQGSRAGLISAIVIFVILWLVSTVFYFQERGKREQAEIAAKAVNEKFAGIAGDLAAEPLKGLQDFALKVAKNEPLEMKESEKPLNSADNVVDILAGERKELITLITGSPAETARTARDYAISSIQDAGKTLAGVTAKPDGTDFSGRSDAYRQLRQLATSYVTLDKSKGTSDAAAQAERDKNSALVKAQTLALGEKDNEIRKANEQLTKMEADLTTMREAQKTAIAGINTSTLDKLTDFDKQIKDKEVEVAKLKGDLLKANQKVSELTPIVKNFRMDPRDNIVRRADGYITRVPGDSTCFINLGKGDQISVGMTFEVYDKVRGIPSLNEDIPGMDDDTARRIKNAGARLAAAAEKGTGGINGVKAAARSGDRYDTQLPTGGKGSIEVMSVGPDHSAQCRIIHTELGVSMREGDLIANLVYDPNVKFKFVVFGGFDLDYNGVSTPADGNTIRRLIEQWGGKVLPAATAEEIGPDTDFIVMGIMPQVLALSADEQGNAGAVAIQKQQQDAKDAYFKVLERAREYGIPVLNQTRFLYYTGYWDLKTR